MIDSDESDKEDDFGQAFYAGSGQQVVNLTIYIKQTQMYINDGSRNILS